MIFTILGLLNSVIIWTGIISDTLRGTNGVRTRGRRNSRVETAYQLVLPVMWISWLFSAVRSIFLYESIGVGIVFTLLSVGLSVWWWYKWKKDSDGRWTKRFKALAHKVKVGEGKLVVVPAGS